jgi:hypothetical protein
LPFQREADSLSQALPWTGFFDPVWGRPVKACLPLETVPLAYTYQLGSATPWQHCRIARVKSRISVLSNDELRWTR